MKLQPCYVRWSIDQRDCVHAKVISISNSTPVTVWISEGEERRKKIEKKRNLLSSKWRAVSEQYIKKNRINTRDGDSDGCDHNDDDVNDDHMYNGIIQ